MLVLQEIKAAGSDGALTIKRYKSFKKYRPVDEDQDAEWQHEWIRLEPLNPEFEAFELSPDEFEERYRVVGEFVQVLD